MSQEPQEAATSEASAPAVESTPVVETPAESAPAPAPDSATESAPTASTSEAPAAEGTATAATAGITDESSAPLHWNGELDSLEKAEWFSKVDARVRHALLDGMRSKYRNLESGFTKKTQELAEERKRIAAQEGTIRAELDRYRRWLGTGDDLTTQAKAELTQLRTQLETLQSAKEDADKELRERLTEELKQQYEQEFNPIREERDRYKKDLEERQKAEQSARQAAFNETMDGIVDWVDKNAEGLWENEAALNRFMALINSNPSNIDPDLAYKMLGVQFPEFSPKPAVEPEPVPAAIDLMSADSSVSFAPDNGAGSMSYKQIKDQMVQQMFGDKIIT